jgi:hypothetical protein
MARGAKYEDQVPHQNVGEHPAELDRLVQPGKEITPTVRHHLAVQQVPRKSRSGAACFVRPSPCSVQLSPLPAPFKLDQTIVLSLISTEP